MNNELEYGNAKFKCPHCNIVALQDWINAEHLGKKLINFNSHIYLEYRNSIEDYQQDAIKSFLGYSIPLISENIKFIIPTELTISRCQSCNKIALWIDKKIIFPKAIIVDNPNSDMNQDIQDLYNEASLILMDSPKGSTALLRLALQKLLEQIGEKGNINDSIANLVKKGLSIKIQQALDILRVVGNNAVHPGEINLDDNKDIAIKLFHIINIIAKELISTPKEIENIYNTLIPDGAKESIKKRDEIK